MLASSTPIALAGSPAKIKAGANRWSMKLGLSAKARSKFGDGGAVLALENQDTSKLSASLWQAGVEVHRCLRQFKRAIERGGTVIAAIERFDISEEVSLGQLRGGLLTFRITGSCTVTIPEWLYDRDCPGHYM
jgi:hypothetical protein